MLEALKLFCESLKLERKPSLAFLNQCLLCNQIQISQSMTKPTNDTVNLFIFSACLFSHLSYTDYFRVLNLACVLAKLKYLIFALICLWRWFIFLKVVKINRFIVRSTSGDSIQHVYWGLENPIIYSKK